MSYRNVFASRLLACRKMSGLSQKALADILNISDAAVTMMEKGRRSPSFEVLISLVVYFSVPTDFLLGRGVFEHWEALMQNRQLLDDMLKKYMPFDPAKLGERELIPIVQAVFARIEYDDARNVFSFYPLFLPDDFKI